MAFFGVRGGAFQVERYTQRAEMYAATVTRLDIP
jgi:hypothetical protein